MCSFIFRAVVFAELVLVAIVVVAVIVVVAGTITTAPDVKILTVFSLPP